jgi:hypothetical protein
MWDLTSSYIDDHDIEGMDESRYHIPPPYEETLKDNATEPGESAQHGDMGGTK